MSEKMRKIVSLETEVMMVGAINHIEIWDPQRFEEMTKLIDDEFDQLIDGVFA